MKRFWLQVNKDGPVPEYRPELGPCWIWLGNKEHGGYGRFYLEGKYRRAHRIAYALIKGVIPDGLVLDHLCRVTACVNPVHLEPVTQRENSLRGFRSEAERFQKRMNQNAGKTHCLKGHLLAGANIHIRPADGSRICRLCDQLRWRLRARQGEIAMRRI